MTKLFACLSLFAAACDAPARAPVETTVSFEDPTTTPRLAVSACVGDPISAIVPSYPGTDWQVTAAPAAFGAPAEAVVAGWLGPGTPGLELTWASDAADPDAFAVIELEDSGSHDRVAIDLELQRCED